MTTDKELRITSEVTAWRPTDLKIGRNTYYDDDVWEFDLRIVGQKGKSHRIDWTKLHHGVEALTHVRWRPLLEELKCLVWTLRHDRREGYPIDGGTVTSVAAAFRDFVPWMMEMGFTTVARIDNLASWNFVQWIDENHVRPSTGNGVTRELTFATAWRILRVLTYAFEQRDALSERGLGAMPEEPYSGRTAAEIAERDLGLKRGEKLDPLPDEIAIPMLSTATKWVLERSDDILQIQERWINEVEHIPSEKYERSLNAKRILYTFPFSLDHRTQKPWMSGDYEIVRTDIDGYERIVSVPEIPRRLVSDLSIACSIAIMGTTGMRASDMASVHVEDESGADFPSCIERKISLDGLTEMFLLKGVEQKSSHSDHSWSLGARLVGTSECPIPVKAICVLAKLFEPYRRISGEKALMLKFTEARSMALKKEFIGTIESTWLSNAQREFANNCADLKLTKHAYDLEDRGSAFRAQQWRGTFANFTIRTNKRALGPLASHFNHVGTMITEHRYIGNDPELLKLVDDAQINLAANTLLNLITEVEPFGGGLAHLLRDSSKDLRDELDGLTESERLKKVRGVVVDHSLRLHFTDYGTCGIAVTPVVARCHQLASSDSVHKDRPNFATRRPAVCAGCQNFLVSRDNLPFWKERAAFLKSVEPEQKKSHAWRHGRELALAEQFIRILGEDEGDE